MGSSGTPFHSLPFCFWGNTVSVAHLPLPLLVNFGTAGTANILASASILGNDEDTLSNKAHSPVMPKVGLFEGGVGRGSSLLLQPLRFLCLL